MSESDLSRLLVGQMKAVGLSGWTLEHRFHPERRWRLDVAFVDVKTGFEVDGGTWSRGRHSRGLGFERDCEKINAAQLLGWTVYRVTGDMVKDGRALKLVEEVICAAQNK